MMPMTARISSRWMRPPARCSEKPSNHNTKRTTTTVQIKLTMKNLPDVMFCYLIAPLSCYRRGFVGVNLGCRDPDPGLRKALSSRARPDGRSKAGGGTGAGCGADVAAWPRAAPAGEDWP